MTTQSNGNNLMSQGRIVWKSGPTLFEGKAKTDYSTGVPILDLQGNPKIEYGFGLAIPKVNPATGQHADEYVKIWQALQAEALTLFAGGNVPPDFAMKFKDGDGVDHNGKSFADREGYAGHIVLTCTTQIPIKFFRFEAPNNILVNDGIKVGDYVNVQLNIKAHPAKGNGKAGLYVNPSAVQLIQPGKEIVNTPSGDQIFGAGAMPSYNGQVVADTAPTMPGQAPAMAPQMPGQAPQMAPQQAPMQQAPQQPQQPAAAPNYGVIPQQHQPQQAPMQPQMPGNGVPPAGMTPAMVPSGQPTMPGMSANPAYHSNGTQTPAMPGMPPQ